MCYTTLSPDQCIKNTETLGSLCEHQLECKRTISPMHLHNYVIFGPESGVMPKLLGLTSKLQELWLTFDTGLVFLVFLHYHLWDVSVGLHVDGFDDHILGCDDGPLKICWHDDLWCNLACFDPQSHVVVSQGTALWHWFGSPRDVVRQPNCNVLCITFCRILWFVNCCYCRGSCLMWRSRLIKILIMKLLYI